MCSNIYYTRYFNFCNTIYCLTNSIYSKYHYWYYKIEGRIIMKYELSDEEVQLIENYRNLLPEFQKSADANLQTLFELQTEIIKQAISR